MQTKLGNHISTQKGYAFKSNWYQTEGMPIAKVSDFTEDSIDISSLTYIPEEIAKDYTRYQLTTGDVVIQTVGSWITNPKSVVGKAIKTPFEANGVLLNQNAVRLDPNKDLDKTFMFYLLRDSHFKNYIVGCAQGAASQASITLEAIRDFAFDLPPLRTQRRIADILFAYDDLIENNTRRIRILEQMAQVIYQEWFGKVDASAESLPKGWKFVTVRDASSYINRGVSPKYDDNSTRMVINQKCIRDERLNLSLVRHHSTKLPTEKYVSFGDVLVNSTGIGTLGRVAQVYQVIPDCTVDSHVSIVRPNEKVGVDYFGFYMLTLQQLFDSLGTGSTGQTELARETIAKADFVLPPKELQAKFGEFVSPLRKQVNILTAKNANLRQTRDLLLPRLVNGEIVA